MFEITKSFLTSTFVTVKRIAAVVCFVVARLTLPAHCAHDPTVTLAAVVTLLEAIRTIAF